MNELLESLRRINAVARNTLIEAVRQKTFYILFLFGLVLVGGSNFFTQFAFEEQFKFLKDIGYAAISWTGLIIALLSAAQLIPAEIERRTIYVVMSKPVRPFEFVLGKYLGLVSLLTFILLIMSSIFGLVLWWKEIDMIRAAGTSVDTDTIARIHKEACDPRLIQAIFLIWAKLCVIASIAVFLSTLATSTIFVVAMTIVIYLIGHLQTVAREVWMSREGGILLWKKIFLAALALFVPDLNAFNIIDEIIAGHHVLWRQTGEVLLYSGMYVVVLLAVSALIFEEREL
ncbi:MAG: ABC transporter permease [Verrucomicrobiota bacterium]